VRELTSSRRPSNKFSGLGTNRPLFWIFEITTPVRSLRAGDFFAQKEVAMTADTYRDVSEIRDVAERFERCDFALAEFTHARHLTVACWYLCSYSREDALERMRRGLQTFIAHHGKHGYHETITRFWMELLAHYLNQCPQSEALTGKMNGALQQFASKDVLFAYYSRDRVMSDEARASWIEPDLRPIGSNEVSTLEFRCILENSIEQS
jgi:hypothetical protein